LSRVVITLGHFRQRDTKLLREHPHGVGERGLLVELEKLEDISTDATPEAVEEPFLGIDVERRRLLAVERQRPL
jgi:hypothetical protein